MDRLAPQIAARPGRDALFALPADKRAKAKAALEWRNQMREFLNATKPNKAGGAV